MKFTGSETRVGGYADTRPPHTRSPLQCLLESVARRCTASSSSSFAPRVTPGCHASSFSRDFVSFWGGALYAPPALLSSDLKGNQREKVRWPQTGGFLAPNAKTGPIGPESCNFLEKKLSFWTPGVNST